MNDKPERPKPPRHAFELQISIGGDDWDYVARTIRELAEHIIIALDAAFMRGAQAACDQVNGYWNGQSCAVRP